MKNKAFDISNEYIVRSSGTSDGTQDKYFFENRYFKIDRYGGEGIAESIASLLLEKSGLDKKQFVKYIPCAINGKNGCYSENFLSEKEDFITFYRLYKNTTGRDLAEVCAKMDYDDAIEFVLGFIKSQTGLDVREYLANICELDSVILNEDRHFNNLGLIFDGNNFRTAPIFDNGKSFLIGNKDAEQVSELSEKIKCAYAKSFSPSYEMNKRYLQAYRTLHISKSTLDELDSIENKAFLDILRLTVK